MNLSGLSKKLRHHGAALALLTTWIFALGACKPPSSTAGDPGAAQPTNTEEQIREHATHPLSTGETAPAKEPPPPLWTPDTPPETQLQILEERMLSESPLSREDLLATLKIASPAAKLWILEVLGEQRIHDAATSQIAAEILQNPHASPQLRFAAVALIHPAKDAELWLHGLKIPEESIHNEVVWRLENAPEPNRLRVALAALQTSAQRSRDAAVFLLGGISDKAAVDALIPELDNEASSAAARDGLFFLLGQDFRSAAEAKAWFDKRKQSLSQDLEPGESFWEID